MTRAMIKAVRAGKEARAFIWVCILLLLLPVAVYASAEREAKISGMAEVNGTRLYYEMAGKGRVVVLIHGGLVDSRMWDSQFKELARNFRVIRYDLRGYGKSAFSMGPYSHIDDLYALLKFLKVERASLVGLSLGSIIAVDFTLEHPEMVGALVLTSSGLRGHPSARNEKAAAIFKAAEVEGMGKAIEMWMEHPFFATGKNVPGYTQRMKRMLADNFRYWGPTPAPIVLTWPPRPSIERLSEIKTPALVIAGLEDAPNILVIADTLEAKIAGAKKVLIPGVSHHLNMEKPKEFNKLVLDFLRR
ncbi:MAG TPA: alpha/beta fold hydrolase [Pyrinomonadaceae bacterium]|nr:alpha/beta fold hydrolase [Pyrinomonadaceae bacterium]